MDMQDQSQTEALAQGGNTQDPNAEFGTSQASGQGTSPAQEQGQTGFDPNAFGGDAGQQQKADDGVVDAEFTEVKDDKK